MQIKSRVTALFFLIIAVLLAVFVGGMLRREASLSEDFNRESLRHHRLIWEKIGTGDQLELNTIHRELSSDAAFLQALQRPDLAALASKVQVLRGKIPSLRLDVYTPSGTLLYSSGVGPSFSRSMLDPGAIQTLLTSDQALSGMTQTGGTQFHWLRAQVVSAGSSSVPYVLALSQDLLPALNEFRASLESEAYLVNLKGRLALGTQVPLFESLAVDVTDRRAGVSYSRVGEKTYRLTRIGQSNAEGRLIGFLISAHDVSPEVDARRWGNYSFAAGFSVVVLAGLLYVFFYLRRSFQPLNLSLAVLADLAKGNTQAQISDEIDDSGRDETARLARGVSLLREDMLNFEMLRDERHRAGLQQERVIRDQLKLLADTLDTQAREEVLSQLQEPDGATHANTNRLADLATTLGRLTALISSQQKRLLQLLHEVREAADSKARLAGLQQELDIARKMQLAILPRSAPDRSEFQITASMIPAKEIGGDFYDYFMLDDSNLAVVVADVSGKGVAAAFFMAVSRTLLKANAKFLRHPETCITELNELLCVDNDQMMFVTLFYGVLNLKSGRFSFVNAGHNPPVILRAGQQPQYLPPSPSMVLAVMEGASFPVQEMHLHPGDSLVLYTDGITEATESGGSLYGEDRLLRTLGGMSDGADVGLITADLIHDVRLFEAGAQQADDITCVVLRYRHPM